MVDSTLDDRGSGCEWQAFIRRLTLERQTGMPRWNLTPAPEHDPNRKAPEEKPKYKQLRRVA